MADKLCLKVCQNFRHEIAILIKEPDFSDTLLSTYPALCDHPQRVSKLKQTLAGQTEQDCDVVLVGACFAGSTTALPVVENLEISKLNQCIYCFAGQTLAEHYMQEGAYLLTPGWLENWQRQISDWAFDQTTAREFFKESASKLVLLDTGVDKDSAQRLQDLATYLDLPTETIPIGLDHFRLFMQKRVQDWKQDQASRKIKKAITLANQKTADYSMAFDLLANLTSMRTEADVVQGVLGTFRMLFAPNRLIYLPVRNDQLVAPDTNQVSNIELAAMQVQNPEHIVHGFRSMPSTDSGACRPLIPEQIVHYFGQPRMGGRHQMGS